MLDRRTIKVITGLLIVGTIMLASCGGGGGTQLPIVGIPGTGGTALDRLDPSVVVPPAESYLDNSLPGDNTAERWLSNSYYPLPPLSDSSSVYQNASLKAWADNIFHGINNQRAANGFSALVRDPHLDAIAQAHARDMGVRNYFDHINPDGMGFMERLAAVNTPTFDHAGENAAAGQETAAEAVTQWVNSPKHRANVMNGNYTHTGVGVFLDPTDGVTPIFEIQLFVQFIADPVAFEDWREPGPQSQHDEGEGGGL